ncbi:hypothetical protein EC973_008198 [Apophysomyces ossiformis]|uniref:RCC1-like domain-containing protein n=1 Tax=Apophysomyces ossiformis TaxID=679940 RepID=A0A8H7BN62_9FUNG|nr:hypothetical protein EC973_008198 [Apophysomyces ossiformis]
MSIPQLPKEMGQVLVFGSGDTGQLGLGEEMLIRKKPMPLRALDDKEIVDVACGGLHSIAITKDGQLWSWGCNDEGVLGRKGDEFEPAVVQDLEGVHIVKVACGDSISMALSDEGKLYCWGTFRCAEGGLGFTREIKKQEFPVLYEPLQRETIVDIAAGTDHCLALTDTGRVYGWGNGQQFQLGRRVIERRKQNGLVPELLGLRNIKAIGSGSYHSFALTHANELYAWGLNNYEQCGLLTEENSKSPSVVTAPTLVEGLVGQGQIKSVMAGEHHTVVLMENGAVFSFGRADSSQLGVPSETIAKYCSEGESNFKKAIGYPIRVEGLENITNMATGSNHVIAANQSGTAYTWGFGETHALGNGSDDDEEVPIVLSGQKLEGLKVVRVAAGAQHTIILARK